MSTESVRARLKADAGAPDDFVAIRKSEFAAALRVIEEAKARRAKGAPNHPIWMMFDAAVDVWEALP
jgi:hypothetical protein